jgi:transposase InsO family protein
VWWPVASPAIVDATSTSQKRQRDRSPSTWRAEIQATRNPQERSLGRQGLGRREVARFIDAYNHRRRHSSCEMLRPVTYEQFLAEHAAEAAKRDRAA